MTGFDSGWTDVDHAFLQAALVEADLALADGEVPVGAVVTLAGRIVGRGHNRTIRDCDPTAHAEVVAIREAAAACGNHRLPDATMYVTLEPCAMCVGALVQARIRRLVFGSYDPKAGAAGSVLDLTAERRLNHRIEVNGGLMASECALPLAEFFAARR
jgi:tRNA(adenine34) deaminase